MATAVQQRLAARILEETPLSKSEVDGVVMEFKKLVADLTERSNEYKTTDLKELLQNAIESVHCSTTSLGIESTLL